MNRLEKIRLAYGSTLMDGGYTLWQDGKKREKGFVVGGVSIERMCDRDDFERFAKLYDDYTDMVRTDVFVRSVVGMGTWRHQGQIHFDVVEHFEDEDIAINKCKKRGELAYYEIATKESIFVEIPNK